MSTQQSQPWDFAQATSRLNLVRGAQQQAENFYKQQAKGYAEAEERYRIALAEEIVSKHDSGVAWSVAPDLARGDKRVAELRRRRDIAEGMKDAALQALWRLAADRRDLGRFIDWSARIDVGLHLHDHAEAEPENVRPIGAAA